MKVVLPTLLSHWYLVLNKYFQYFSPMLQLKSLKLSYMLNLHSYATIYYMLLSAFLVVSEHLHDFCLALILPQTYGHLYVLICDNE